RPAVRAKAVNRAVRAAHDRRNRVAVARPKSVAHRRERQGEVVRNRRPHVLDVPRKSGARKLNVASPPSSPPGRGGHRSGYLGNQGGRSYAKRQVKVLLMFSVRLSLEN